MLISVITLPITAGIGIIMSYFFKFDNPRKMYIFMLLIFTIYTPEKDNFTMLIYSMMIKSMKDQNWHGKIKLVLW